MKKHSIFLIILVCILWVCFSLFKTSFHTKNQKSDQMRSEIIQVKQGYGYQILVGDKLLVKQEYIPAVNGEITFQTPKDAKKVADLVKKKLLNRLNPEVSLEELSNLNIITLKP